MGKGRTRDTGYLTLPQLEQFERILHAFTTRHGGLGGRNNGQRTSDDWLPIADAFGISPSRLVTVNQVHGENIVRADPLNYLEVRSLHADAVITDVPQLAVGIETADCVPVLLYDPARPAVGAVHAGWRSTVKKIVQKAVNRMSEQFGSDPARMIAAIGPAIGPECYEVDEPVMSQVRDAFSFWKRVASPREGDRWSLDLGAANRIELTQIGLPEKNIHSLGMCTSCRKDLFYSFRSEGKTGRILSAIMIKA